MPDLQEFFNYKIHKEMIKYASTYMCDSAILAIDGNAPDIQTTGSGVSYMLNGVPTAFVADAAMDVSDSAVNLGDCVGDVIATGYSCWFTVLATAAGELSLWRAGDEQLDGDEVLKVHAFDPAVHVCVGFIHLNSAGFTVGTTDWTTVGTFFSVTGPVYPHADNIDKN